MSLDIEGVLSACPSCGHDWSGHATDPDLADRLACAGKRGLGYVSGCRCRLTLAAVLREQIAAWLADFPWTETARDDLLAALAAQVAPSRVPGEGS